MLFSNFPISKSISVKLLVITFFLNILAMCAIAYTLSYLWQLEGAGAVINDAGSLRMRTYRLILLTNEGTSKQKMEEEIHQYSTVLQNIIDGDSARPLFLPKDDVQLKQHAIAIQKEWRQIITPKILENLHENDSYQLLTTKDVDDFILRIDRLVYQIEENNTHKINRLRFYQRGLLGFVLLSSLIIFFLFSVFIIRPLARLNQGIHAVKRGDFEYRIDLNQKDEFGVISLAFNEMAAEISRLYASLEEEVKVKTQDLKDKNSQLQSLYSITSYLQQHTELEEISQGFVERVTKYVGANAGAIRLIYRKSKKMELIASVGLSENMRASEECSLLGCCSCGQFAMASGIDKKIVLSDIKAMSSACKQDGYQHINLYPILNGVKKIGILTLYFHKETELTEAQNNLLISVNNQLGISIRGYRLVEKLRQMAILEERNLMAQGMHDSIAQVLTFLNLQVQMLEQALKEHNERDAKENLISIRRGIQQCYEDVRELLLNFRMPLNKGSFLEVLKETIHRFEAQTTIKIRLSIDQDNIILSPQEELEIIFILQEGLSNIRKHAEATMVDLDINASDGFVLKLCDNGLGFDHYKIEQKQVEHVGLAIMNERAQKVGATLIVHSQPHKGCQLTLRLPAH